MRRAAVFGLLLAFAAVSLHPFLSGSAVLPERATLTKRGADDSGGKTCDARKPSTETISAGVKRQSSSPLRRSLLSIALPAPSLALQAPSRDHVAVTPAYLRIYSPANSQSLRAPPV